MFIEAVKNKKIEVHYFDDLSYNHENGLVLYYDKVIDKLSKYHNLKYYDYSKIKTIQNN